MRLSVFSSADSRRGRNRADGAAPENRRTDHGGGHHLSFGTRRVVAVLPEVDPGRIRRKGSGRAVQYAGQPGNAVVVLCVPIERKKLKAGKSAQKLIAQCKAIATLKSWLLPGPLSSRRAMIDRAKAQGTSLPDGAAAALLERCGEDPFLLENEVDKLWRCPATRP